MRYLVLHRPPGREDAWEISSSKGSLLTTTDPDCISLLGPPASGAPRIEVRRTSVPTVDINDLTARPAPRRRGLLAWLGVR